MRKPKIYSEEQALRITGLDPQELENKVMMGLMKGFTLNGKKYYKLHVPVNKST